MENNCPEIQIRLVEYILLMCELHNKNLQLDSFAINFSLSVLVSALGCLPLHDIFIHTNYSFFNTD